jgi:hypothetical protein
MLTGRANTAQEPFQILTDHQLAAQTVAVGGWYPAHQRRAGLRRSPGRAGA